MTSAERAGAAPQPIRLTFRNGGWVLLVAALLAVAVVLWAFAGILTGSTRRGGNDLASYGFDLSTCLVPTTELTPSGQPRDFLRPLTVDRLLAASAMVEFNTRHRKRYVVSDDRVIGVAIGEATRAYPLYIMNGHEVVEDTLGGVPIAVTYSPLSDSVAVYDRRVGERVLHLHLSGVLHQANGLLYDASDVPSLWRQLDGRAIAGPAAARGESLRPIAGVALTTWADWITTHPTTDVPERIESNVRLYEGIDYRREHAAAAVAFPFTPVPADSLAIKSPVILLDLGESKVTLSVERLRARAADGVATVEVDGTSLRVRLPQVVGSAWRIEAPDGVDFVARGAFWFAAHAIMPERPLLPPQQP